jgi:ankyrin repeat protein
MRHLKKYEAYGTFSTGNELVDSVLYSEYADTKKLLYSGADVNSTEIGGNTALLYASYYGRWKYVYLLLKYNPDWTIKDTSGCDFIDYINEHVGGDEVLEKIKKDYPEKYAEYIAKKEAEKYNL